MDCRHRQSHLDSLACGRREFDPLHLAPEFLQAARLPELFGKFRAHQQRIGKLLDVAA
jgi:hypothetical protein